MHGQSSLIQSGKHHGFERRRARIAASVRHLRQALLWPLRLMPVAGSHKAAWEVLRDMSGSSPWREVVDEYTGNREDFHERHYHEFTAFLPYVQRFLYGEGRSRRNTGGPDTGSPMRVFRRHDIAQVRMAARPADAPLILDIVHADLYFFFDVDLVLLNLEVSANDLSLAQAQELLYRFGRAYPGGWDDDGQPQHCMASVEWLGAGWNGAGALRRAAARALPGARLRTPGPAHLRALGLHAPALRERPLQRSRAAAISPDRVLPHAADGLSGAGQPARR